MYLLPVQKYMTYCHCTSDVELCDDVGGTMIAPPQPCANHCAFFLVTLLAASTEFPTFFSLFRSSSPFLISFPTPDLSPG